MPNVPQDGPREAGDQALVLLRCVDISWGKMRDGGGGREGRGETIDRRVARDRMVGNRAVGLRVRNVKLLALVSRLALFRVCWLLEA